MKLAYLILALSVTTACRTSTPPSVQSAEKVPVIEDTQNEQAPYQYTAEEATILARQLPNMKTYARYQCQPFQGGPPAQMKAGRWVWRASQAYGTRDFEADVSFAPDGSARDVQVFLLSTQLELIKIRP